ncbi:MAG: PrsW family intramembrane metalloprotease [Propionibacteriaceae bacterium]|jgi:RsiW-degrading membrane proteinase PrsW (M82 family)|nr:PrsW family intramembrane metalloprotease [Propionibacteriaceae bacterium]
MALAPTTTPRVIAYERNRAGVPQRSDRPWWRRLVHPWFAVAVGVVALEVFSLTWMYRYMTAGTTTEDGTYIPGFNDDALWLAAKYAFPTMAVLSLLFMAADRFRPQRLWLWLLALTWGGSVACAGSLFLNEWTSSRLAVMWWEPGYDSARLAVFIAPFVEEAMKAAVLFLIAIVDRGRITSRVSGIALAGLAAVGFAFTENIVYYGQVLVYGSYQASMGEVMEVLKQYVMVRGVQLCFGHPLFTVMAGLGIAVACRHRSKTVRVVAPITGYLAAALLHMCFNTVVTPELVPTQAFSRIYVLVMLPMVLGLVLLVRWNVRRQGRLIAQRLTDHVVMGFLPAAYPGLFSRLGTRAKAILASAWWGNPVATVRLQNAVTELAFLRDAVSRGVADEGALWREHELIGLIARLRSQRAIENPQGLRPYFTRRGRDKISSGLPLGLPAGIASSQPTGSTAAPAVGGSLRSSAVDPRWGPPA